MELDFSREWHIVAPPSILAARELADTIGRMSGQVPVIGDRSEGERLLILDAGNGTGPGASSFAWRASPDRVEVYGSNEGYLLRGVYDFLDALGARWVAPGEGGERLPSGPVLSLDTTGRSSKESAISATLILGHGVFLERWEEYLLWASRAGYSSVFIHTSPDALALGAAPESLYEAERPRIAALARSLGLALELGGHGLSSLLPRRLYKEEPDLFRESKGERAPDRNLCPSSDRALCLVSEAFAERAAAHPEISVFHAWPDDLPGGGWCSCARCAQLSASAQSLKVARALAAALAARRPDAALSFLAYHDTEDVASALGKEDLPPNLELLWAPRRRSWGTAIGDGSNALNAGSLAAFRKAAGAWRAAGGGRVVVFEYWEDAVLFKGAVPPLTAVIAADLAAYCGEGPAGRTGEAADAVGLLCTGGRLPLGPRPNAWLLPALARNKSGATLARALVADWASASYGPCAPAMLRYWTELEAAWAIDLDIEEGETSIHAADSMARYAADPPADWGDPWTTGLDRLAARRGRCEELFDHLRRAEVALAEASALALDSISDADSREARAVRGETEEYAISGALLELDCARLSVYHELASGEARAAADIATLALSASAALRKALARISDRRSRREIAFLVTVFYDLRLKSIRRANARSGARRVLDLWFTTARTALAALPLPRAYEPRSRTRWLLRTTPPRH